MARPRGAERIHPLRIDARCRLRSSDGRRHHDDDAIHNAASQPLADPSQRQRGVGRVLAIAGAGHECRFAVMIDDISHDHQEDHLGMLVGQLRDLTLEARAVRCVSLSIER